MTHEEAIRILKMAELEWSPLEYREAFDMAIEVMRSYYQKNSGKKGNRMIQIDMEKPNHCLRCPMCDRDAECVLIQEIDNSWDWEEQYANCPLQEVEPERKTGHWIYYDEYAEAVTHTCSECGKRMTTAIGVKASFCWNCGADMREGEQK